MNIVNFNQLGFDKYIYLIAEIGINHNGSIDLAKKLIDQAVDCGCDAVKFQKRDINTVYSKEILDQARESPWGNTQREQKEGLEFSLTQYEELDKYCKGKNIDWFASSWDKKSQLEMRRFKFKFNKIASAMATNLDFVEFVASEGTPTFASTGMTEIEDIEKIVEIFKRHSCELMLMHTVSTYPSLESDLNLKCINMLKNKFKLPVGYSGHEVSVSPSVIAATLGACAIERHITLDRSMYGSDQSASLQEEGFRQLVSICRKIPILLGDGEKKIIEAEKTIANKLRYWKK
ncbi:N-acetylneuraminate synthase [Prochlorococcus marinus str. MIT 9312]|uniref:N-acetylneuraminate synthase n=1 Tax=Prochlorococcus marinus (strain MIT 9312) TaxID=74546 RepID=Q319N9_PROM9|nr:N-acetylneuraminate synthase family protein [Prochlorococcus marinus]ABB50406.1 N-acetylneuraminate synthase [Prochlorococcus marinus str. MIT 9312]KGF99796.1 N-acetylneuraminate synthase [Prochlorococcus marinus str. MIT 9311]